MKRDDPRQPPPSRRRTRRYCYHSAIRSYKTDTLVRKWTLGEGNPRQRRILAFELSLRDPPRALALVREAIAADPRAARLKTMRLCLHHVADVATARELLASADFDPDALHLTPFAALLDDFLVAAPALDPEAAEARLRKLGFLAGPAPNPLADAAPAHAPAATSSSDRYGAVLVRFLSTAFAIPSLAHLRPALAYHLLHTYGADGVVFLVERWRAGEVAAVAAIAGFWRLGFERTSEILGAGGAARLVEAFVREMEEPQGLFEDEVLAVARFPQVLDHLPASLAFPLARALLASPRRQGDHEGAAAALLHHGAAGATIVLEHAAQLTDETVAAAAARLPYDQAASVLEASGELDHPALRQHPDAPPDRSILPEALEALETSTPAACQSLGGLAADQRHPDREAAYAKLLELAVDEARPRARRLAIYELGRLGDARATPAILAALADDTFADAHLLLLTAIGDVGDARALDALDEAQAALRYPEAALKAREAIVARGRR